MSEDLASEIRNAVSQSGIPLVTISKDTGVEVATLTDFMDGADVHLTTAQKITSYLGLELRSKKSTSGGRSKRTKRT